MRFGILLTILFLSSCTQIKPRKPASEVLFRYGDIAFEQSRLKSFPVLNEEDSLNFHFLIELKDSEGQHVDCDPSEIIIKDSFKKNLSFHVERLLVGRYSITDIENTRATHLEIYVRGKILKAPLKIKFEGLDRSHSRITVIEKFEHRMTLQLRLADKKNRPLSTWQTPEILFHGLGEVTELKQVGEGLWVFDVIFPEENQIMYFSVRAQGAHLEKLFRYHYIDN